MSMDYDTDDVLYPEKTSVVERIGYREGASADAATSALRDLIHRDREANLRRDAERREVSEPEPAVALPDGPAGEKAATVPLSAEIAQRHAVQQAEEEREAEAEELDEPVAGQFGSAESAYGSGHGGGVSVGGSGGSGGAAGGAVSATADMGSQAHVGGTGVVSTASAENLDLDDLDDAVAAAEEAEVQKARQAAARAEQAAKTAAAEAAARAEAETRLREAAEQRVTDEALAGQGGASVREQPAVPEGTVAPAQRVLVRRGEPIADAVYKKAAMRFDDSGTAQVKAFPASLEQTLRDDLATMTNASFAKELPISQLLTAFVASQLGAAVGAVLEGQVDENTVLALRAFRMLDHRTGAIEQRMAELETQLASVVDHTKTMSYTLRQQDEHARVLENGVVFLVSERVDPSTFVDVPASQIEVVGGKYRHVRDRLRKHTGDEIRDEKIAKGRPLR